MHLEGERRDRHQGKGPTWHGEWRPYRAGRWPPASADPPCRPHHGGGHGTCATRCIRRRGLIGCSRWEQWHLAGAWTTRRELVERPVDNTDDQWATAVVFVGLEVAHGLTLATGILPVSHSRPPNERLSEDPVTRHRRCGPGRPDPIRQVFGLRHPGRGDVLGAVWFDPKTTHGPEEHGD